MLQEYDRANRLEIDALYAQFSPTLDDYYAEELRIDFPTGRQLLLQSAAVLPDLVLTRTVPGAEPRSVHARGAAFPLAQAWELFAAAMAAAPPIPGRDLRQRVDGGQVWLCPAQAGRTQEVRLVLDPGGRDAIAVLEDLHQHHPR